MRAQWIGDGNRSLRAAHSRGPDRVSRSVQRDARPFATFALEKTAGVRSGGDLSNRRGPAAAHTLHRLGRGMRSASTAPTGTAVRRFWILSSLVDLTVLYTVPRLSWWWPCECQRPPSIVAPVMVGGQEEVRQRGLCPQRSWNLPHMSGSLPESRPGGTGLPRSRGNGRNGRSTKTTARDRSAGPEHSVAQPTWRWSSEAPA